MHKNDKKLILLVEDEQIAAKLIKTSIEKSGYTVITAEKGETALKLAAEHQDIILILMDIDLGAGIDGAATAKKILEMKNIPIVFLTSHTERELLNQVRGITRYGYVLKNSGEFVLLSAIEMALDLFDAYNKAIDRENRLLRAEMISGFGSWELDLNKKTVTASAGAKKIYGLDNNEFTLDLVKSLPLQQYRPILDKALEDLVQNGTPYSVEFEIKRQTDSKVVSIHSAAEYNRDDNIVTGIIRDISERKQARESLRRQSDRMNIVMENGNMAWWEIEFPAGSVIFNRKKTDMLGYEPENFTHYNDFMNLVHPDDFDRTMQAMKDYMCGKKNIYHTEYRIRTVDGKYRWFRDIGTITLRNADDSPQRITGLVEDITDRKKNEEALRESEDKYRLLAENASDVIWILDVNKGRFSYISPSVERLRGFTVDEIIHQDFSASLTPESMQRLVKILPDRLFEFKKGIRKNYTDEVDQPSKDGNVVNTEVTTTFIYDNEGNVLVIGVSRDITERKQLEKTQQFLLQSGYQRQDFNFFSSLARFIGETLGMDYVSIDQLHNDGVSAQTLAVFLDGKFGDNIKYLLYDTPEAETLRNSVCVYKNDVQKVFPKDKMLKELNAETYISTALYDSFGRPIGLISAVSRKQKENTELAELIIKQVGFRTAGELDRRDAEDKLLIAIQEADILREKAEKAKKEKELLLKEVHHRIKNNMNTIMGLLLLQTDTLKDASAIEALEDAGSRVKSMMMLYDKLYRNSDFRAISVKYFFPSLIEEIIGNFPNSISVQTEINLDDFILSVDVLSCLSIIVNELLTNIMKYAFTGRDSGLIIVTASIDDKNATFIIEDNGSGIELPVDIEKSSGFGLQLVGMLTKQIKGSVQFERGSGTRVVLKFKTQ